MPTPTFAHLSRPLAVCGAFLASSFPVLAQSPADPAAEPKAGEVLSMSKFEVVTTQGKGYVANNAATGFKTNEELLKIPQSVTVVTRDLIEDIGSSRSSDVLQYAGASNFYRGESIALRGARINNAFIDEAIDNTPYMDNVFIDSYEVIRGPAGVLYNNAALGGAVLKSTKKPLPYRREVISLSVDEWGKYRSEFDFTGPAGNLGEGKLGYRLTGAYQDGDSFFKNVIDRHTAIHPSLQFDYKDTTVRLAVDYQKLISPTAGRSFLKPNGEVYTGAGRDEGYYGRGEMETFERFAQRLALLHRFSSNWEMKMQVNHQEFERSGGIILPSGGVNWVNNTVSYTARRNYQRFDNWVLLGDFIGKYKLGPLDNQSAFGYSFTDEINRTGFWASSTFGTRVLAVNDPQMDSIIVPRFEDYTTPPANPGAWTKTNRSTAYYQHTIDVIPDRLKLVGGLTWATLQADDITNLAVRPRVANVVSIDKVLHRYGIVFNITKDIALYALDSTTFAPQANSTTRDINGALLPAQEGKGQEVGFKTSFFNGRLSSTFSVFDLELTNVAVVAGVLNGVNYFEPVGLQKQRGFDFDIAFSIVPGWQLIGTGYVGKVEDQNGGPISNTYKNLFSVFTRYDVGSGTFKGLAFGGGASRTGGRIISSSLMTLPTPKPFIDVEPGVMMNAFVTYKLNRHWDFRVNVENVLDDTFAMALQTAYFVDVSPPRTFQFSASYRF